MKEPIRNNAGKLVAHLIDGQVIPLAPVPEGDAYDDLWDLCATTLEKHPRLKGKFHSWLLPSSSSGQHSQWLGDEVAFWIREGNLRTHTQVNEAVSFLANHYDRLVRLGVVPEWQLDPWIMLKRLRWFFAIPGSKPLPTKTDIIAEDEAFQKRQAEQDRKHREARKEEDRLRAEWEKEFARDKRIKDLTQTIALKLFNDDRLMFDDDNRDDDKEFRARQRQRRGFMLGMDDVAALVDAGKGDSEIEEEMIMRVLSAERDIVTPDLNEIPPLKEGELRKWLTPDEYKRFIASDEMGALLDEYSEMSVIMAKEKLGEVYVVTFFPKVAAE